MGPDWRPASAVRPWVPGLSAVGAIVAGCFSPDFDIPSCALQCERACMPGFTCRNGFCVRTGEDVACPGEVSPFAGAGGSMSQGGVVGAVPFVSGAGQGGRGPIGGSGPDVSGSGGEDARTPKSLELSIGAIPEFCTGERGAVTLRARGGVEPYRWSLRNALPGLSLAANQGRTNELVGAPATAGVSTATVVVEDAEGAIGTAAIELRVFESPRVTTDELPFACLGSEYGAELEASGGDPETYRWSLAYGVSSGLAVEGGHLSGTPAFSGMVELDVQLEDAHCRTTTTLALEVDASCPAFHPSELAPPCAGTEYRARVDVDGEGEYTLRATALPASLEFDPATRELAGVLDGPARVTLEATDEAGRRFAHEYALTPRNKCWLAYVSNAGTGGELHFFDPLLGNRVTLAGGAERSATSFRFSPDGRWLAYQSQPGSLTIVRLRDFAEQSFDMQGIVGYAWSSDSSRVAVERDIDGAGELDGVALVRGAETSGAELAVRMGSVALPWSPLPPALVWSGNASVFLVTAPPDGGSNARLPFWVDVVGGTFSTATMLASAFNPSVAFRAFDEGVFAIDPEQELVGFYERQSVVPVFHGSESIAPNGQYTARIGKDETLLVFRSITASKYGDAADLSSPGCSGLVSWTPDARHVFCRTSADRIAMYALNVSGSSAPSTLRGQYTYSESDMSGRRRVMSPGGRLLAFMASESLYVANVAPENPRVFYWKQLPPMGGVSPSDMNAELAFSPDERWLLVLHGPYLWLHDLLGFVQPAWIGDTVFQEATECFEEAGKAPNRWCGLPQDSRGFAWFSASDAPTPIAVAKARDGRLLVFVMREEPNDTRMVKFSVDDDCVDRCVGQFEFQP